MYRISEQELAILSAVEHQADIPLAQVAKVANMRTHSAAYYLAKLKERGILGPRRASINTYRLGFSDFHFLFSVAAENQAQRERFLAKLEKTPAIVWLAEVGGGHQYAMSLRVKQVSTALLFMKDISEQFPHLINGQRFAIITTLCSYGRRYLNSKARPAPTSQTPTFQNRVEPTAHPIIDEIDQQILAGLCERTYSSEREFARVEALPITTVQRRVRRLEHDKIISGYYRAVDAQKLGYQVYKLVIFSNSPDRVFFDRIREFVRIQRHVVHYLETLGDWQAELLIDVKEPIHASEIARDLRDALGSKITAVHVMPIFRYIKSVSVSRGLF